MKLEVMDQAFDGDILPETAYIAIPKTWKTDMEIATIPKTQAYHSLN